MFNFFNISEGYTLAVVAAGAALLGGMSGIVGTLAVLKKQSLLADAIAHAGLPGIVLVFIFTGISPSFFLIGAAIAGWLAAMQIFFFARKGSLRQNSSLSLMLSVYFGFGMVLLSLIQHKSGAAQAGIETFLFGQAATMLISDVKIMAVTGAAICLLLLLFWKEFLLVAFDSDCAAASGIPVILMDALFTIMVLGNVVIGLQTVGVILMGAMLTAPAAAARQWTNNVTIMLFISMLFGAVSGVAGSVLSSFVPGLPTGPTIIACVSVIAFFSFFCAPKRGIIWKHMRRKAEQASAGSDAILEALYMLSLQHTDKEFHGHPYGLIQSLFPLKNDTAALLSGLCAGGLAKQTGPGEWSITPEGKKHAEATKQGAEI